MPPKPKFSKEEITKAAYQLMEENGIESVVAREVAKKLGCTTAPIFTFYSTMEELKDDVFRMALERCSDYLNGCMEYTPAFKEFGIRWIRFAKEHPNAYSLVFILKGTGRVSMNLDLVNVIEPLKEEIMRSFGLSEADSEQLIDDVGVYGLGIAAMIISGTGEFDDAEISRGISRTCLSYVAGLKILDGSFNLDQMKKMLENEDSLPKKKI